MLRSDKVTGMACLMMIVLILAAVVGHVTCKYDNHVIDLTHAHSQSTIYWPGVGPDFNFTILYRGMANGHWYESNYLSTQEHGGTHIDAPAHMNKGKERAHQIPMSQLIGPGVIVNVKTKVANNSDYRVTVDDLKAWESKYNKIPTGSVVLMNSGWSNNYPNKTLTFGSETPDTPSTFHFPGWHEDAADWLVKQRHVHVVGVDTPSTDYGQSTDFPVHIVLGTANVPGVENVANLDSIPESGAVVFVAAIKLFDGSGGPARVFATYSEDDTSAVASSYFPSTILLTVMVAVRLSL